MYILLIYGYIYEGGERKRELMGKWRTLTVTGDFVLTVTESRISTELTRKRNENGVVYLAKGKLH